MMSFMSWRRRTAESSLSVGALSEWRRGRDAIVVDVPWADRLSCRLREMGLLPGVRLRVLRTGDAGLFRFAEAMTRHTGEVDVYHLGRFKGLGTRHGVQGKPLACLLVGFGCGSRAYGAACTQTTVTAIHSTPFPYNEHRNQIMHGKCNRERSVFLRCVHLFC